jgi:hypothetical protein
LNKINPTPSKIKRIATILLKIFYYSLGVWICLAVFYTTPAPLWLRALLVGGLIGLFVYKKIPKLVPLSLSLAYLIFYLFFVLPNPSQHWAPEHSRLPQIKIEDNLLYVSSVRNFRWKTASEFEEGFYDRVYDLNQLERMYYIIGTIAGIEAVGHVFLSFKFKDGNSVSISVEGRREEGIPYAVIPSMFRRFQVIYAVGDEADVLGLRGAIWKKPVYFYPARISPENARWVLVDMMKRAESLEDHPEFYHLILNNCMNNITYHLRRLGGGPIPRDIQLLLTGFSDRVAHRMGLLDTDLPFRQARQLFRVDDIMQEIPLDENFSKELRTRLNKRLLENGQAESF